MRLARRSGSLGPARSGDQPEGSNKPNRLVSSEKLTRHRRARSRDALHKLKLRGSDQVRALFADSGPDGVATVGYFHTDPGGVATPAHYL